MPPKKRANARRHWDQGHVTSLEQLVKRINPMVEKASKTVTHLRVPHILPVLVLNHGLLKTTKNRMKEMAKTIFVSLRLHNLSTRLTSFFNLSDKVCVMAGTRWNTGMVNDALDRGGKGRIGRG
jgi:hypothetical protein